MSGAHNLLPCPFGCENAGIGPSLNDYESGYQTGKRVYDVSCGVCGTTTRIFGGAADAVMMWNSRTHDEAGAMQGRCFGFGSFDERLNRATILCDEISDEADLCRNDGVDDIADLLDEARGTIWSLMEEVQMLRKAIK